MLSLCLQERLKQLSSASLWVMGLISPGCPLLVAHSSADSSTSLKGLRGIRVPASSHSLTPALHWLLTKGKTVIRSRPTASHVCSLCEPCVFKPSHIQALGLRTLAGPAGGLHYVCACVCSWALKSFLCFQLCERYLCFRTDGNPLL